MTRHEFRLVPTAMLGVALSATTAPDQHATFTLKMQPPMFQLAPAISRGSEAPRVLLSDNLSKRFDSERLAAYEDSRRQMHQLLLAARSTCDGWKEPAINLGLCGQLELQWWRGRKSLTLIVDGFSVSYLKAWGHDIQTEMSDGEINDPADLSALWSWLQG